MAIIDKSGAWHGKFGDLVYFVRDGRRFVRDYVKAKDAKTAKQLITRELTKEVGRLHISSLVINAAIEGIPLVGGAIERMEMQDDFYSRLIESNQLALCCGWLKDEPMHLYPPDKFLHLTIREHLIWAGVIENKICILAFVPPAPWKYIKLALRVKSCLAYRCNYSNQLIAKTLEVPVEENPSADSLEESFMRLPEFCRDKAQEFISRRWGNWDDVLARTMLKGAGFVYLELPQIPVPASKFGVDNVKIADLNGGRVRLEIDIVGMTQRRHGEFTFYACVRSKPYKSKNDYIIDLPQRNTGKFAKGLAERLARQAKEYRNKYFSNPAKLVASKEYKKGWAQDNPEKVKKTKSKYYLKIKKDPVKYAALLAYGREWKRKRRGK